MDRLRQKSSLTEGVLTLASGIGAGLLVVALSNLNIPLRYAAVIVGVFFGSVVVLMVRDIKHLLWAAIFVDLAVGFDVHIPCYEQFFLSECGFNISVTAIALILLYAIWIMEFRSEHHAQKTSRANTRVIGKLGAVFFLVSLVSLTVAQNVFFSLYMVWVYVIMLALFYYLVNNIKTRQDLLLVIAFLIAGLVVQVVVMQLKSFQVLTDPDLLGKFQNRISGTYKSPNIAGAYLMQMILLLLPCLALPMKSWLRAITIVTLLIAAYSLIGTMSRGAWTGVLIGISVIGVVSIAKKWLNLRTLAIIFMTMAFLGVIFSGPVLNRLESSDNGSAEARGPLMQIAWNMITANPLVGVGWNNFGLALYGYIGTDQFGAWLNLVHNAWLLLWSETGTLSFLLYVAFWLSIFWYAIKLIRGKENFYALIALGILASMAGAASHMMVEIFASRNLIQIIWTYAAIIVAMTNLRQRESSAPSSLANSVTALRESIRLDQFSLQTRR